MSQYLQDYALHAAQVRQGLRKQLANVSSMAAEENRFHNAFHMADANLRYFFPALPASARLEIIEQVLFQQQMAVSDQQDFDLITHTEIQDQSSLKPDVPVIYCTYHAGSYRHLFHYLARQGIDCLLFVANRTLQLQGDSFLQDSARGTHKQGWQGRLETVDAEHASSLLTGARALKRGKSVVIYIDGNAGVGSNKDNGSMVQVDLLGRDIMARSGVAYLAYLSGRPIVPVTCQRATDLGLRLSLHPAILPAEAADAMPRDAFIQQSTQRLYHILQQEIAHDPGQWEGWLYVHKFLKRSAPAASQPVAQHGDAAALNMPLRFASERFAVLHFGAQAVLLDKERHCFTMLGAPLAACLHDFLHAKVCTDIGVPGMPHLINLGALCVA